MEMAKNQGGMGMSPDMQAMATGGTAVNPAQMPPWMARANAGMRANMGMEPGNPGSRIPGPPQPGTPMATGMPPPQMPQGQSQLPQLIAQMMARVGRSPQRGRM